MNKVTSLAQQLAVTMFWLIVMLVLFVAISKYVQDHDVPVLSNVFGWAQSHAGLDQ